MPPGKPGGAMCVQRFDDSRNSAIRITYRISLRSSSMPEPRDPLLKHFEGGLRRARARGQRAQVTSPPAASGGPAEATRYNRQGWE
ncbi:hypothetical protein Egran_07171, partial [Elaphomyces granulatus]